MIHIRKQIIISSIGISLLCSISTNFCMENKKTNITPSKQNDSSNLSLKDTFVHIGLKLFYEIEQGTNEFVNEIKKGLQNPAPGNKKLVQQTTTNKLKPNSFEITELKTLENELLQKNQKNWQEHIKKIAEKIDDIKWKPQQQKKVILVTEALQLVEHCKNKFNITEHDIGQAIYDNQPLDFPKIDNKKVSVILKIIKYSSEHQSNIEAMYETREKYLAGEINNFYTPPDDFVIREVNDTVEHYADALYKTEQ